MKKPSIKSITLKNLVPFFLLLIVALTVILTINFRTYAKSMVEDKVLDIAEVIKAGLTAHMKANTMDQREYFIQEVTSLYEVKSIHIIRSKELIAQYGSGNRLEKTPDTKTQVVLDEKKPFYEWEEFGKEIKIRAIIPFQATTDGTLNCLSCHNVPEGTVLGAVDMQFDGTAYRDTALTYIFVIILLLVFFSLFIVFNMVSVIERYIKQPLKSLITQARESYATHVSIDPDAYASREFKVVAENINNFNANILDKQKQLEDKNLELEALNTDIEETLKETIFTMGQIEELRSDETRYHTKRVVKLSALLAQKAGLSEEDIKLITVASPIHDIGKLGVPDSILKKPAKLNSEEFEIVQTHADMGFSMLKHSKRDILKAAGVIAHEHHERWDGDGYPQGLKGEEIHIYARVVAIADVFDALASKRVYKKAWSVEKVEAYFKEQQGKQFDPALVEVLLKNMEAFFSIIHKHADD